MVHVDRILQVDPEFLFLRLAAVLRLIRLLQALDTAIWSGVGQVVTQFIDDWAEVLFRLGEFSPSRSVKGTDKVIWVEQFVVLSGGRGEVRHGVV